MPGHERGGGRIKPAVPNGGFFQGLRDCATAEGLRYRIVAGANVGGGKDRGQDMDALAEAPLLF